MKKIGILVLLFAWIVGVLGGFGYLMYIHQYPIAIFEICPAVLSWKQVVKFFKELTA